jgi:hypothetical protein
MLNVTCASPARFLSKPTLYTLCKALNCPTPAVDCTAAPVSISMPVNLLSGYRMKEEARGFGGRVGSGSLGPLLLLRWVREIA